MNSIVCSCGVNGPAVHSAGNVAVLDRASETWKSLNSTRPHWVVGFGAGAYATGVSNVKCSGPVNGDVACNHCWAGVPVFVAAAVLIELMSWRTTLTGT